MTGILEVPRDIPEDFVRSNDEVFRCVMVFIFVLIKLVSGNLSDVLESTVV